MIISGYLASMLIGVSLGLIGGGGSIFAVPVLVYLFGVEAVLATTYSLFVVGVTSIVGSGSYFKRGLVDIKTVSLFGIPAVIAVLFTRACIVPAIPAEIIQLGNFTLTRSMLVMLLFAILMIIASYSMLRRRVNSELPVAGRNTPVLAFLLQGTGIGFVTGLVGAGGGFLIIPALVNMLKLPMKVAVGTSLVIIAISSLTGFFISLDKDRIEWAFLLVIAAIAVAGILIGSFLSTKIDGRKLKPAFGWFVLAMGIYIIIKEVLLQ